MQVIQGRASQGWGRGEETASAKALGYVCGTTRKAVWTNGENKEWKEMKQET